MKIGFIINKHAGSKKRKIDILEYWIKRNNIDAELHYTEYTRHATEIAKELSKKELNLIACIGGDGTINEVISGLRDTKKTIGIIPQGSGNGLARHLKIPLDFEKSLNLLLTNKVQLVDVISINDHLSINISGIGFDGQVAHKFSQLEGRGLKNYIKAILQEFRSSKEFAVDIVEQGKVKTFNTWLISICNSSQYGNNAIVSPLSDCSDGIIDFILIKKPKMNQLPVLLSQLVFDRIQISKLITRISTPEIIIKLNQKNYL
ncbi:MAG: hypothetical protein HYZ42_10795 [Bacteroidetes bacterium]|nr:hypothetical protein [Bacteroidota bacterium]